MRLACEATLNIAKRPEILEKMREAFFVTIFCGIETPDPDALKAMQKDHNMMVPILEGVRTINSYGMEVVSGIIMGLDTDKPETGDALLAFVEESNIPLLTINLLQALPQTPLWDRLAKRKPADRGRQPRFQRRFPAALRPGGRIPGRNAWKSRSSRSKLYARYQHQVDFTYANRLKVPVTPEQKSWPNIKRGLTMLAEHLLEGRRARRLQEGVLEIRAAAAAARRYRRPDLGGAGRAPSDQICAPGFGRAP